MKICKDDPRLAEEGRNKLINDPVDWMTEFTKSESARIGLTQWEIIRKGKKRVVIAVIGENKYAALQDIIQGVDWDKIA